MEIVALAGKENNYIFGAEVDEIEALKAGGYNVAEYAEKHKEALNALIDGTFSDGGTGYFAELYDSLTKGASWHKPDNYFVLYDLEDYVRTLIRINRDYADKRKFAEKQLRNVANSAYFSSDRTISEYARDIWKI